MKISIENLPEMKLGIGRHKVIISEIKEGIFKGIAYFSCKFENKNGYIWRKFYLSEFGLKYLIQLLKALEFDIKRAEIDTSEFLKKELIIRISNKTFYQSSTQKLIIKNDIIEFWHIRDLILPDDSIDDYTYYQDDTPYYDDRDNNRDNIGYRNDDLDSYHGDLDDFTYGGLKGEEAVTCWLNTN